VFKKEYSGIFKNGVKKEYSGEYSPRFSEGNI